MNCRKNELDHMQTLNGNTLQEKLLLVCAELTILSPFRTDQQEVRAERTQNGPFLNGPTVVPTTEARKADDVDGVASATDVQKKVKRFERFGMPVQLSEEEKRNSRVDSALVFSPSSTVVLVWLWLWYFLIQFFGGVCVVVAVCGVIWVVVVAVCGATKLPSELTPATVIWDGFYKWGKYYAEFAKILTRDALQFVADLQREFRNHIKYALECRKEAKMRYNNGGLPGFDPATKYIREEEWVCAAVPPAVADRRVEITGPVERKMIINALNSGAKVFMTTEAGKADDVDDATSATDVQKKVKRAERFGMPVQLSEEEKRNSRADRCSNSL
ncbi:unnamed protein product [Fraxinus pennsylvanica]|uniref:Malate synthase n=1 Tax=Fraxinus pennsylvanica TaxID=56036 RepID=A0AAD2AFP1_9LAMI|nr:unnamed protein product [Fraxinus pennsylvanica]